MHSVSTRDLEQKVPPPFSEWNSICSGVKEAEICSSFLNSQVTAADNDYSKWMFMFVIYLVAMKPTEAEKELGNWFFTER